MNRRQFLQCVGISVGLAGAGVAFKGGRYFGFFSGDGLMDFGRFLRSHLKRIDIIPEEKGLVDSHAHFSKNNLQELVDTCFEKKVFMQVICGIKGTDYVTYEEFREGISSLEGVEVDYSDRYATVLKKGDEDLVITQGEEFKTRFDGSKPAFLRKYHEMHIVLEGFDDIQGDFTYEFLRNAEREGCLITTAHPFTIPVSHLGYLPANKSEIENIENVCSDFDVFVEGGNATNTLWMSGTNSLSRKLANRMNSPLVYSTDCHPHDNFYWVEKQIGSLATLITRFDVQGLDGREIIQKKYKAIESEGEMFGLPMNTGTFYNVMVKQHNG